MTYVPPEFKKDGFTCPYCGAFSHIIWRQLLEPIAAGLKTPIHKALCQRCHNSSWWLVHSEEVETPLPEGVSDPLELGMIRKRTETVTYHTMLFPSSSSAPLPHKDMPKECAMLYQEAREIVSASPRGAAALLRLIVQKLCIHFGLPGKVLFDDIGELVKQGLPTEITDALDSVRVIGNHAVHPKEIDLNDTPEIAQRLFDIVNYIVEELITRPAQRKALFAVIPQNEKVGIDQRNQKNAPDSESK